MEGSRARLLEAGMDGYLAKPIRAEDLFREIDALFPATGEEADALLDEPALLRSVGGNRGLLAEVVAIFLDSYPATLGRIHAAIEGGDPKALEAAAHSLKGAVGFFFAKSTCEAAHRLEKMGAAGDLSQARDACKALEREVTRLGQVLAALTGGGTP
jgi:two-component system, sensor histidine kinase and response regulator